LKEKDKDTYKLNDNIIDKKDNKKNTLKKSTKKKKELSILL
jgi:hypothetical protein